MDRGDIWLVDLEPTKGREQRGTRPVFIVSPSAVNRAMPPLVCPIATAAVGQRLAGFAVPLHGTGLSTIGVVLCVQIRVLDVRARNGRLLETAPAYIVDQVLDCLRDILA